MAADLYQMGRLDTVPDLADMMETAFWPPAVLQVERQSMGIDDSTVKADLWIATAIIRGAAGGRAGPKKAAGRRVGNSVAIKAGAEGLYVRNAWGNGNRHGVGILEVAGRELNAAAEKLLDGGLW
jgi:hypothetical protein